MSLHIEHQGAVAVLTLDRPEARNALDAETVADLGRAIAEASANPAIRVVLLQATGPVFCSGADL
ncbi:MAG: enoyl-CoA hydratase/isomerase family protein, partial [Paracoccaceae bacterium]